MDDELASVLNLSEVAAGDVAVLSKLVAELSSSTVVITSADVVMVPWIAPVVALRSVEVLMVMVNPVMGELGDTTNALDSVVPTVAPTVAELAEMANNLRFFHCVVVGAADGASDSVSVKPTM
jgi:hypothetical protein